MTSILLHKLTIALLAALALSQDFFSRSSFPGWEDKSPFYNGKVFGIGLALFTDSFTYLLQVIPTVKVFVYHTPELTPPDASPDCAIAIDVLRATTTIATALAAGAEAVQAFSSMEDLMRVSESWPQEKRLRAGERGGAKVAGCDLGNSPLDCTPERVEHRRLFMSTTNGTRCLERIQSAQVVLAGALINRQAIVSYLNQLQPQTLWLVGSGWEGSFSLEDTLCAGAILDGLQQTSDLLELAGNDEAVSAHALFQQWESKLLDCFHYASHGQRLLRLEGLEDLKYCADLDSLDVVPIQRENGVLIRHG